MWFWTRMSNKIHCKTLIFLTLVWNIPNMKRKEGIISYILYIFVIRFEVLTGFWSCASFLHDVNVVLCLNWNVVKEDFSQLWGGCFAPTFTSRDLIVAMHLRRFNTLNLIEIKIQRVCGFKPDSRYDSCRLSQKRPSVTLTVIYRNDFNPLFALRELHSYTL